MRISFSSHQQVGSTNLSYQSNANLPKNTLANNGKPERGDSANKINAGAFLGGKLKKNGMLESLMTQKSNLMDNKDAFMERALKNGQDPSSIEKKLESFDEQIEEINEQISKIKLEERRKSIGYEDESKKIKNSKKTSKEVSPKSDQIGCSMDGILSLSANLSQTKALSSQMTLISGEVRVLDSEIKIDEQRGFNPVRKRKRLAEMKDSLENITEKLGDHVKGLNGEISNNTQSDSSNNVVDKDSDEVLVKKQQVAQNIKHYTDNINFESKNTCGKINAVA